MFLGTKKFKILTFLSRNSEKKVIKIHKNRSIYICAQRRILNSLELTCTHKECIDNYLSIFCFCKHVHCTSGAGLLPMLYMVCPYSETVQIAGAYFDYIFLN